MGKVSLKVVPCFKCGNKDHYANKCPNKKAVTVETPKHDADDDTSFNMNYFTENIKLNETICNQKLIIARLQRENDENIKLRFILIENKLLTVTS